LTAADPACDRARTEVTDLGYNMLHITQPDAAAVWGALSVLCST
jgi:hypothetical protein